MSRRQRGALVASRSFVSTTYPTQTSACVTTKIIRRGAFIRTAYLLT